MRAVAEKYGSVLDITHADGPDRTQNIKRSCRKCAFPTGKTLCGSSYSIEETLDKSSAVSLILIQISHKPIFKLVHISSSDGQVRAVCQIQRPAVDLADGG